MQLLELPETSGVTAKPWGIPALLAGLAVPFLLWATTLGIALASDTTGDYTAGQVIQGIVLTVLILDGVFVAVPAYFCLRRYGLGWPGLGFLPFDRDKFWMGVAAAIAAHVWVFIYGLIILIIFGQGAVPQQDVQDLFSSRVVLPLVGVSTVIVAPLAEEIFFRGFVFAGLLRPVGLIGALVVSALLFAGAHVTGADSAGLIVPFLPIGILFAWLYYKTGTIWTNISAHFTFNLVSFILLAATATISI